MTTVNKINAPRTSLGDLSVRAAGPDAFAALAMALSNQGKVSVPAALAGVEQALATEPGADAKLMQLLSSAPPQMLPELQQLAKREGLEGVTGITSALLSRATSSSFSSAGPAAPMQNAVAPQGPTSTSGDGLGWSDAAQVGGAGAFHEPRPTQQVMGQLSSSALQVDPQRISSDVQVTTQAEMSIRELAAAAFGIPATEVGDDHYVLLAQSNPEIAQQLIQTGNPEAKLPAGTKVSLATTPAGLEMRLNTLKERLSTVDSLLKQALGPNPSPQAMFNQPQLVQLSGLRNALTAQISELENARSAAVGGDSLARAQKRGGAVPPEFDQHVQSLQRAGTPQAAQQARGLQTQQVMAQTKDLEAKAGKALMKNDVAGGRKLFEEARQLLAKAVSAPGIGATEKTALLERKASLHLSEAGALAQAGKLPSLAVKDDKQPPDADKKRVEDLRRDVNQCVDAAKAEFGAIGVDLKNQAAGLPPEKAKPFLDYAGNMETQAKLMDGERHNLLAAVATRSEQPAVATGDYKNALAGALGMAPQELDGMLAPDVHDKMMGDGQKKHWWNIEHQIQDLFGGEQKVGSLSPEKVKAIGERIAKLPENQRSLATEALVQYATSASSVPDATAMAIGQQILWDVAGRVKDPGLNVQAENAFGNYMLQINNGDEAVKSFGRMKALAQKLPNSEQKSSLISQAVMGQMQGHAALAAGMEWDKKKPAAQAIKLLRLEMEKPGSPMPKEMVVKMIMQEMATDLDAHMSEDAQACLDHLRKNYVKDVPWLKSTLDQWEKTNKDNGGTAALQTTLKELTSESMLETFGGFGAGAAIGSVICPGPGTLIGGAIGTLFVKGRNLIRGFNGIQQSAKTGLNNESLRQSITDSAILSFDALAVAAPFKGVKAVANGALKGFESQSIKAGGYSLSALRGARREIFDTMNRVGAKQLEEQSLKTAEKTLTKQLAKTGAKPTQEQIKAYAAELTQAAAQKHLAKATKVAVRNAGGRQPLAAEVDALAQKYANKAALRAGKQAVSRESWRWFNRTQIPAMVAGMGVPLALAPSMAKEQMANQKKIGSFEEKYVKEQEAAQEKAQLAQLDAPEGAGQAGGPNPEDMQRQIAAMDPAFGPQSANGAPVDPQMAQADTADRVRSMASALPPQTRFMDKGAAQDFVNYRQELMSKQSLPPEVAAQVSNRLNSYGQNGVAMFDPVTADVMINRDAMGQPGAQQAMQQELARQKLHSLPPEQYQSVVSSVMKDPSFAALAQDFVKANPQAAQLTGPQLVDELLASTLGKGGSAGFLQAEPVTKAGLSQPPQIPTT